MIGIDTNVLVRYLVQDDLSQSRAAHAGHPQSSVCLTNLGLSIASCSENSSGYWKAPTGIQMILSSPC